jgi:hypothetical protein
MAGHIGLFQLWMENLKGWDSFGQVGIDGKVIFKGRRFSVS